MQAGASSTVARPASVLGVKRRRWGEEAIRAGLFLAAALSILTTVGIVASLIEETIDFFRVVPVADFLTDDQWSPLFRDQHFGIWPLINGTLIMTGIALAVAIPLGLGSAIYLAEYARPRVRRTLKPILEVLAGIPTIVFGFFALTFFAPNVLKPLGFEVGTFSALSAGIIMGFMVLPTIASVAEDAMTAVPQSLREGAFGLGASKLQVSLRVVFPAALSGIVAAVVLGFSRAIGETMIVLIAGGSQANSGWNPEEQYQTMTAFIAATGKGDVATSEIAYKTIFAVGFTLFVLTLIINAISIRFVRKFRQVYE